MNQLKLYRQVLVGRIIVGLGNNKLVLDNGDWWKLAAPFDGDRLNVVGRPIASVWVVDGKLELIIDKEYRLYLHWRNEHGVITGPEFPTPGQMRVWDRSNDDPIWENIDRFLDLTERWLNREGYND